MTEGQTEQVDRFARVLSDAARRLSREALVAVGNVSGLAESTRPILTG